MKPLTSKQKHEIERKKKKRSNPNPTPKLLQSKLTLDRSSSGCWRRVARPVETSSRQLRRCPRSGGCLTWRLLRSFLDCLALISASPASPRGQRFLFPQDGPGLWLFITNHTPIRAQTCLDRTVNAMAPSSLSTELQWQQGSARKRHPWRAREGAGRLHFHCLVCSTPGFLPFFPYNADLAHLWMRK